MIEAIGGPLLRNTEDFNNEMKERIEFVGWAGVFQINSTTINLHRRYIIIDIYGKPMAWPFINARKSKRLLV